HVKDNFRYDIWIELTPEISKFNTLSDYIEYVNFCGEVKEINVLQVEIFDSKSCLLRKPVANVKIKPMIFLGSYFSGSINLSTLTQLDNLDHLTLRITPPQTILEVDIEDSIGKKILTNLNFKISRKVLLDHEVEIILRDEDSNPDVFIELCMILLQNKVNKSVFRIKMKDFNSPHSRYAFYDYADRMNSSNSLKIRDIHSKIILLTAQSTISMDNVGDIKSMVDFYRKVIYLQDQFNVRFDMPGTIYDDEVRRVDSLCELISRGYVLEQIKGFNFDTENIVLGDFERLSEQKTPTLFQCNFVYIKLFNCNLNFEKNLICIVPRALITKSRNNGYDLIPQTKVLLIFEPIYGEFNVFEVIKKHGLV
ncbi:MAG: hypothetical protein Q8O06_01805, partial [Acetobacterium sp.]|nr:hypothetical protein [Acetobacterium sp.]